ncbi:hypothetical protein FRB95_014564 [Tulasnella sp. JGI-2019a]|nr:hypothetical protein FRB95_014564 [Tulasnella sp. JGI-2019a]
MDVDSVEDLHLGYKILTAVLKAPPGLAASLSGKDQYMELLDRYAKAIAPKKSKKGKMKGQGDEMVGTNKKKVEDDTKRVWIYNARTKAKNVCEVSALAKCMSLTQIKVAQKATKSATKTKSTPMGSNGLNVGGSLLAGGVLTFIQQVRNQWRCVKHKMGSPCYLLPKGCVQFTPFQLSQWQIFQTYTNHVVKLEEEGYVYLNDLMGANMEKELLHVMGITVSHAKHLIHFAAEDIAEMQCLEQLKRMGELYRYGVAWD